MEWTLQEAVALCTEIEAFAPTYGCHVGLTGGCLYGGTRKDCDIILYRIRQCPKIAFDALFERMATIGVVKVSGFGFCHKAVYQGKPIDFLAPEEEGAYNPEEAMDTPDESDKPYDFAADDLAYDAAREKR